MYNVHAQSELGSLTCALRRNVAERPDHLAIWTSGRSLSYREFEDLARRFAVGLLASGVERGDRVAIALPNGIEATIAIYGVLLAGGAFVPLNPTIKADKLAAILANCAASALIGTASIADMLAPAMTAQPGLRVIVTGNEVPGNMLSFDRLLEQDGAIGPAPLAVDLAAIIYTSGSTGVPKGVTMTHQNMVFASSSISTYLRMTADDRILSVLPLSFDYGLYQLLLCVHVGASLFLEPGIGFPGTLVRTITTHGITGLPGVPTLFQVLLSLPALDEYDWSALRFLTNTGAALHRSTIQALRTLMPDASLYAMYGQTECKRVCYLPPAEIDRKPDSVGIAIPGTEVWIEDDTGRRVAPGEVGELMVRGPHVMQGYWNDPERSAKRLRPGRWPWERILATGDLFRQDAEGFLYFVGRSDEIIKSRGEKVSPREVEDRLLEAPGVLDVAVVGVPHTILGDAVWAHVSPRPGISLDARGLQQFCQARLESHLVPYKIVIHEQLPKTPNGKIDKRALAAT
ncbi:AMP-binding protein [Duganella sp. FT92W]|uniref:AMP-binding protein n=1 Tax=Pseudoduganella rivuli TaxID=2666085 RepID=A0A7X2LRF1_9BURK|nr:AMP-binding protein [Pseudoduganella rivuli]MRV72390.1 AMP-binding protein [Pseudoduganella rivuli]